MASITEINTTVQQIDRFTQENAAMVEESSAAARNLATLAGELAHHVSQFRIARRALASQTARPLVQAA